MNQTSVSQVDKPAFLSKKSLFWSADLQKLDLKEHKQYIINQVLKFGTVKDFHELSSVYSHQEMVDEFLSVYLSPRNDYRPQTANFVKKILLQIE